MARTGEPDAARLPRPARHGGAADAAEFIAAIGALAATDGSAGWRAALTGAGAAELPEPAAEIVWAADPDTLVAVGHRGRTRWRDGRLSGEWTAVTGADRAAWLLLSVADDAGAGGRVLVAAERARIEPIAGGGGLAGAGIADVRVAELPVGADHRFAGAPVPALTGAAAAAAVTGAARGACHAHVEQVRRRLAASFGSAEAPGAASIRQVARAAGDLDAAELQIAASLEDPQPATAQLQAALRAGRAVDRLLAVTRRHALDGSDPVTGCWLDVQLGCRLTRALLGR
ncbi:hypothetical protein [Mycobacterium sp. 1274756.6]|uniref:hypothetical protein n=1 Tax=Mycobacterium sp. 1274756.6 TaxID=1834076 RepID=UPI0008008FAA|nr:hypothetical protein [Mycobacterium sp. 1274756.6]OBJ69877.1 hypothetical protein A5643_11635 [Mycobacterium sp. 1274756.6]